jgi:hypothetical protein
VSAKAVTVPGGYAATCECGWSSWFGGTGAQKAARTLAKSHAEKCTHEVDEALAAASRKWHEAKHAERAAMIVLYSAIARAVEAGMSEVSVAQQAGVDRMTVRRALGKR